MSNGLARYKLRYFKERSMGLCLTEIDLLTPDFEAAVALFNEWANVHLNRDGVKKVELIRIISEVVRTNDLLAAEVTHER